MRNYLHANGVETAPYESARTAILAMASREEKLWLNDKTASSAMFEAADVHKKAFAEVTPISMFKAVKNEAEVEGMKNAHLKVRLVRCGRYLPLFRAFSGSLQAGKIRQSEAICGSTSNPCFRMVRQCVTSSLGWKALLPKVKRIQKWR